MLIDSHCHLSFKDYSPEDLEGVLQRAAENDVNFLVTIGAGEGLEGNKKAIALAKKYPQIFCTIGIHPHDANQVTPEMISQIEEGLSEEKVVAVGEIGLDFHYEHSPRAIQEQVFHQFLDLAKKHKKPIMIHDRESGDRTFQILKEHAVLPDQVMIHCFTGNLDLAKKYLSLGCYLSFTGIITFKKSTELQEIVKKIPTQRMLIETDSPYLAPVPFRGKRNEPSYVKYVAQKIAELQDLSFEDVARITTRNAKRFFKLPLPDLVTSLAYAIRDSLYLNITNRCTLACTFCPKFVDYEVKGYYLKLKQEPTVDEILSAIGNPDYYKEIVFCGYGEPTRRLDVLLEIAGKLKEKNPAIKIRVNSDGLGNLIYARNILPELGKYIDAISVSLNAHDAATYARLCPSKYKEAAYPAVKEFIRMAPQYIKSVTATVVGHPDVNREACRKIVEEELGVCFRFREFNNVG